jgi:hypothetical protein
MEYFSLNHYHLFWFFGGIRIWTQGFALAKQTLEPHLQFILVWLFLRWSLENYLLRLAAHLDPPDLSLP